MQNYNANLAQVRLLSGNINFIAGSINYTANSSVVRVLAGSLAWARGGVSYVVGSSAITRFLSSSISWLQPLRYNAGGAILRLVASNITWLGGIAVDGSNWLKLRLRRNK